MKYIKLKDVSVDFPIFSAKGRSLKSDFINIATGGKLLKSSTGNVTVSALNNINLELKSGDRLGIIGHNGAGKSTMLKLLTGVYSPTSGSYQRQGEVYSLTDISLGIEPEATGIENIVLRSALLGITKKEVYKNLENIVEFAELGDFINMPVRTYSTGMHLRLAFSVSTMVSPDILIMDEWLSVGDENFKHKAEVRLRELMGKASILVLASHSKELIMKTCNRVIWLEHGTIKDEGTPEEICNKYFS
ncbi:lipopolysaccharide/O-antigen transport protein [Vibrio cholerae]|nr:putative O-antigen export system, ATP binding protein [Vibrio cholerae]GHX57846.1 lipopolysaccharide/O-antigen transport protein [Vibrio cholerae]HAS3586164.1 ABC transporter ATP-binding protein [Vibrio cholerae]